LNEFSKFYNKICYWRQNTFVLKEAKSPKNCTIFWPLYINGIIE